MGAAEVTAVLVGGGQCVQRDPRPDALAGPVEMMAAAARQAAEEAGPGGRIFSRIDAVGIVDVLAWRPRNAARLLAEAVGARPTLELVTTLGGESPLLLLNHVVGEIQAGRVRAALLAGSNNVHTLRRVRKAGQRVSWPTGGDGEPTRLGVDKMGSSVAEQRYGLSLPPVIYPLYENALRASRGLDLAAHRAAMGELMSRMTRVAARDSKAWFPVARTPEELTTPGPDNRMIAFPYPKYLNAVMETDQSAAVLLLSEAEARALGIPPARQVHVWGRGAAVEDPWFPTQRPGFTSSDAMRFAAHSALAEGGLVPAEVAAFDLYSCFPVAVEMACEMLGLAEDDPRGVTVTGGLPYFGGPGNNYALHAVVRMAERLRAAPGRCGLVTGNGWYFTKHTATLLGSAPRAEGGPAAAAPAAPAAPPAIDLVESASGRARIETYTVTYARDGAPEQGIVVGRLEAGGRFLANTPAEREVLEDLCAREGVGRQGRVAVEGGRNVFHPD